MPRSRHIVSASLDHRLLAYASTSWNAHEAVYALQQLTGLLPAFRLNLETMYGPGAVGDARRMWGVVADLAGAMTGLPPDLGTLSKLGFGEAAALDHIADNSGGDFRLSGSLILHKLDFKVAAMGDLTAVLRDADVHDRIAKPLLDHFRGELAAYDTEAAASEVDGTTFRRLAGEVGDTPSDFPLWDGRPMFLDEQRSLLDYLAKSAGADLVADHLVDEQLGEFLLRTAGILRHSELTDGLIFDVDAVPNRLLNRSVQRLCEQVGGTVLGALRVFDGEADILDRLFVVEMAVKADLGIDISVALAPTRRLVVERKIRSYGRLIDLTEKGAHGLPLNVAPYELPDLSGD